MKEKIYLGIDVGTTHLKVCAVKQGKVIEEEIREEEYIYTEPWGRALDAAGMWMRVKECIKKLRCRLPEELIAGIGITSMAESCVLSDSEGKPVMPIVPWNIWKEKMVSQEDFPVEFRGLEGYRKTGLIWHPKYTINQIIFLRKNYPDIFKKIHKILSVSDYLLFCLTGEYLTEESLACRTMMYNIFRRKWDEDLTEFAGVKEKLPRVIRDREEWPEISADTAEELGILSKIKVYIGGHDHLCAAAAQQLRQGEILNSMGTSEVYIGFLESMEKLEKMYTRGIQAGIFQGKYYWICNMPSSGASIEWLRRILAWDGKEIPYKKLMLEERKIPSPVMYLPFVNGGGTHRNFKPDGSLRGLDMETSLMDIAQGIYEGISFETRVILDLLQEAGIPSEKLIVTGGGSKNSLLMQAKADIAERPIEISREAQDTVIGAALAYNPECRAVKSNRINFLPDQRFREAYRKKYKEYQTEINGIKNRR